jgi:resuscitation-promoting factor RpfB
VRKSAKFGLYALVLTGMVGGTAAWATTDKAVAVTIDGQARTIHTRAGTVGGALKSAHVGVGAHDVLAPAEATKLHDGSRIVVLRGRQLRLNVDGTLTTVWTTASTVSQALSELGYGTNETVSVSRSTRLPLTPTQLTLLTPKAVSIRADHRVLEIITTDRTVGQALSAAGVRVGTRDKLSAPATSRLTDGQVIVLKRVRVATKTTTKDIPFTTKTSTDSSVFKGTTVVVKDGHKGLQKITWQLVYVDGKLVGKRVTSTVVAKKAVTKVQKVGTKSKPKPKPTKHSDSSKSSQSGSSSSAPVPTGSAQSIARSLVSAHGWSGDQFSCLVQLWNRESGWSTHAANSSGAYGIPQALPGSKMSSAGPDWQSNAGTQIKWGLGYISARYGSPCGAWGHSQSTGWY